MEKKSESYDFMKKICDDELSEILDLLSGISSIMMDLTIHNEYLVDDCLERIGHYTKASRVYVFMFRDQLNYMDNVYEWCNEGVSSEINMLQHLATDDFRWWMVKLLKREIIFIEDVASMDASASAEREILLKQGIQSLITVPIFYRQELIGYIGIDFTKEKAKWNVSCPFILKLVSELFSSGFERLRQEKLLYESQPTDSHSPLSPCESIPPGVSFPAGSKAENVNGMIEELFYYIDADLRLFDHIEKKLAPENPFIFINKYDFFQILMILLQNSIDEVKRYQKNALDGHSSYLSIKTRQNTDCVVIELLDSGEGFSHHDSTEVFNPFFTTKELGEGTGLGLTYAYDLIVNKYHGSIQTGNCQEGGLVTIKLPIFQ
ncbi:ATP-binding protein [Tindallia californiensis]|uniref:histidine kinase n=1 Tax=Tindallia californiensis TaxID=159292 RepID=A0A1H3LA89_9FIRM|nr:ATP-binding protein [Tindallia californiensis]SDY61363.1 GAF domain-containing protein [Tindallia californiensis]